jgi:hypothetical protein
MYVRCASRALLVTRLWKVTGVSAVHDAQSLLVTTSFSFSETMTLAVTLVNVLRRN